MAIGDFPTDIRAEIAAHELGQRTEYLGPGIYVELLRVWIATYGVHRVKVLLTEDLGWPGTAQQTMRELEDYLGLPAHDYTDIVTRRFNHAKPASVDPATRTALADFYRPHNARLQDYLGREVNWD